jgi:hypothetical protein
MACPPYLPRLSQSTYLKLLLQQQRAPWPVSCPRKSMHTTRASVGKQPPRQGLSPRLSPRAPVVAPAPQALLLLLALRRACRLAQSRSPLAPRKVWCYSVVQALLLLLRRLPTEPQALSSCHLPHSQSNVHIHMRVCVCVAGGERESFSPSVSQTDSCA